MPRPAPRCAGFTLIEVVIVIAVIAILAALITPLAVNQITARRFDACREELQTLKKALAGDPALASGGLRNSFGFVGDMGRLPVPAGAGANRLTELTTGAWSWVQQNGIWWGWRGPYVSELLDPWGNEYYYSRATTETALAAAIWSAGPDGVSGNSDDVAVTLRWDEVYSRVSGNTLDACSIGSPFSAISVSYPDGSAVVSTAPVSTTAANPVYTIATWIPIGVRRITFTSATPTTVAQQLAVCNGPMTLANLQDPGVCN